MLIPRDVVNEFEANIRSRSEGRPRFSLICNNCTMEPLKQFPRIGEIGVLGTNRIKLLSPRANFNRFLTNSPFETQGLRIYPANEDTFDESSLVLPSYLKQESSTLKEIALMAKELPGARHNLWAQATVKGTLKKVSKALKKKAE